MRKMALLDTSLDSDNSGDEIIVEAITSEIESLAEAKRIPTHRYLTHAETRTSVEADSLIVTGTNILSRLIWLPRQWKVLPWHWLTYRHKVVFLGVGWRQYQARTDALTSLLLRMVAHSEVPLAARDRYTLERCEDIGLRAIYTGCPTMWSLPDELSTAGRRKECVFTVTDYHRNDALDLSVLNILSQHYERVLVWPQGDGDLQYLEELAIPANATIVERGLDSLNSALSGRDYVGTRLHAGVRAAQLGSPSCVVAVDNRGIEIGKDTGFPVIPRTEASARLEMYLNNTSVETVALTLPKENIATWKHEFAASQG